MGGIVRPLEIAERFEYSIIKPHGEKLSAEALSLVETFEEHVTTYRDA